MKKYVSLDKRSKKAKREYHAKQRQTWGGVNPATRTIPDAKAYNRKKEKEKDRQEFKDGFDAGLGLLFVNYTSENTKSVLS